MDATATGSLDVSDAGKGRAKGEVLEIEIGGRRAWVFQRVKGGNFYVKGNLGAGKQFYQSTGFSTKGMALDAAKKKWKAALLGKFDELEATKLRKVKVKALATIGEVVRAHALAFAEGRLDVTEETAVNYQQALRRVVGWATGLHEPVGERHRADKAAIEALSLEVLTEGLVDEAVRKYVALAGEDRLQRDARLRAINSAIANARAMFEAVALKAYKDLRLPDLKGFLEAALREEAPLEHAMLEDAIVRRVAAAALQLKAAAATGPMGWKAGQAKALYLVHLLFRHFGLRNDEIENARAEWVEKLEQPRVVYLANGEKREVVAVMKVSRRSYWIPKASTGEVGIAAEVLAELAPYLAGKRPLDYLVPAETVTDRRMLIYRDHSNFMKPFLGSAFQKTSYELRRWGATVVARLHQSEEMATIFLRHTKKTTAQVHYLTERPLPAPITLADCGL